MNVKILCGVSGSGKSTYAKSFHDAFICSADDFFIKEGKYNFNVKKLSNAHGYCLRKFVSHILNKDETIIVDNTNTSIYEISPYASLALAYDYELKIVIFKMKEHNLRKFALRNIHGVNERIINRQFKLLEELEFCLPNWLTIEYINT